MQRRLLEEHRIHSAIREKWASYGALRVAEVQAALTEHRVVVVGMRQNPYPRRARQLLNRNGIAHHYLEYGSYLSQWKERLPLKLWTGWPTFPMIFVNGVLIGGFNELERLLETGELGVLIAAPRT
jgi:glutaredoxin-related protein